MQTNYGSTSMHAQWFSHLNNGADNCDIIIWCQEVLSCAMEGGNYKRGDITKLKEFGCCYLLSSGCFNTSVWVFTKPQTLHSGCLSAPQIGSISWMYSAVCFSHKHASRPIWRTLSYCDFIYLMATGQTTTSSPWTWYWAKHGSQPFSSKLQGQDKSLAWCESLPVYLVYLCHPTKCGPVIYIYIYIYIYIIINNLIIIDNNNNNYKLFILKLYISKTTTCTLKP